MLPVHLEANARTAQGWPICQCRGEPAAYKQYITADRMQLECRRSMYTGRRLTGGVPGTGKFLVLGPSGSVNLVLGIFIYMYTSVREVARTFHRKSYAASHSIAINHFGNSRLRVKTSLQLKLNQGFYTI